MNMPDDTKSRLIEMAEGVYIEDDVLGVIERIQGYDPNLRVQYLAGRGHNLGDAPYRVMEVCPDGIERMVMSCWELDERVIQRLFQADTHSHDILRRLDGNNSRVQVDQKRRFKEELAEASDIAQHVLKSPKTAYTVPSGEDNVVMHSHEPARREKPRKP